MNYFKWTKQAISFYQILVRGNRVIPSRKFNALQLLFYSFESRIVKFGLGKMNRKIIVGAHIDGIDIFFHSSPRVFEINGIRCN